MKHEEDDGDGSLMYVAQWVASLELAVRSWSLGYKSDHEYKQLDENVW